MPAETRVKLAGLCLECLAGFVLGKEEAASPGDSGEWAEPDVLPIEIGTTFHGMQFLEFIARGGMGIVFKARQPDLDRVVAVKVLSPELGRDPEFTQRFNVEAKVLARLSHPNIVQVYDFGREGDLYFLVMEFVDGVSLRQALREKRLSSADVLPILSQVCTALEHAHRQGIVHRDIKPENILIDARGRVRIADFGLAKILKPDAAEASGQTRVVMGTPQYMAPEQCRGGEQVDHRADIYALGVILYEMLTGAAPHGLFSPPSRLAPTDRRLDDIVLKALEKSPERRYQSATDLKTDLEAVAAGRGQDRSGRYPRRIRVWAAVLVAAIAAVAAAGVVLKYRAPTPQRITAWQWENPGPGSLTEGGELVFTPNPNQRLSEAIPLGSTLGKKFHLRFRYRYLIEEKQEPWLFLILDAAPGSGHERNGIIFFAEGDHTIAFASRVTGKGWGLRDKQSFPAGSCGPGKWMDIEVSWKDEGKRLRVLVGGVEALNAQLGVSDSLDGSWHFGLGGAAKEARIREVTVVNAR
jgi:tRNA A-37 threonylcarbamoyl transferase component Bud32